MKLIKNGSQNAYEKTDFKDMRPGKDYRDPSHKMPAANSKNTQCSDGPLKPTPSKAR